MKESSAIKGFPFFGMSDGVRWNQAETYQRGHKKGTLIGLMDIHDYLSRCDIKSVRRYS
jgi:hypothetical protein